MNPNETRYANAIRAFVENELNVYESAAVYEHLRHDFELTDKEISDLGYDFLIPAPDETESNELPPTYRYLYEVKLCRMIEVQANSEEEAEELLELEIENLTYDDMDFDGGTYDLAEIVESD